MKKNPKKREADWFYKAPAMCGYRARLDQHSGSILGSLTSHLQEANPMTQTCNQQVTWRQLQPLCQCSPSNEFKMTEDTPNKI